MAVSEKKPDKPKTKPISFSIDGKPHETVEKELAAQQLLVDFAELDPSLYYLVEIRGKHQIPYKDPATVVRLHKDAAFITVSTGPTPVS